MLVKKRHPFTGKIIELDLPITSAQLQAWQNGTLAQDAFPLLDMDQREFLISGIPPGDFERSLAWNIPAEDLTSTGRIRVAEASTLGLPVGQFPDLIVIGEEAPVYEKMEPLPDGGWRYKQIKGPEELHILND